jgi:hypothetical protein
VDAIDKAIQTGISDCLRKLQKTSSLLFLNASQLRRIERDALYVPAVSKALSSILFNAANKDISQRLINNIQTWGSVPISNTGDTMAQPSPDDISSLVEGRLRAVLEQSEKAKTKRRCTTSSSFHEDVSIQPHHDEGSQNNSATTCDQEYVDGWNWDEL